MKGYWNRPEETAGALIDGWVHSETWGMRMRRIYLHHRSKKDMIIYKGYNVYPRELEEILFTHPSVLQCAVIGKADESGGEIP